MIVTGSYHLFLYTQEICHFLEKKDLLLVALGDSLTRHLFDAVGAVVAGDVVQGAIILRKDAPEEVRKTCVCDNNNREATISTMCRSYAAAFSWFSRCATTSTKYRYRYIPW